MNLRQQDDSPETTIIALRIPVKDVDYLKRRAEANERTMSAELRWMVRQAKAQDERKKAA